MPRIPKKRTGYRQQGYQDPTIQRDGSGVVNKAVMQASQQVQGFTMDLMKKRKNAQDQNYAFEKYMEDFEATTRFEEQLKREEGENPETYALRMKEFTESRIKAGQENAPSDEARDMYNRKAVPLFTKADLDAENYQNIETAKYYFTTKDRNYDNAANALLNNPNYGKAKELATQIEGDYESDVDLYGEKVAREFRIRSKNKLGTAVLDGLYRQERYTEGLALLRDNEAEGSVLNEMQPDDKARLMQKFTRGLEAKKKEYNSELTAMVRDKQMTAPTGGMDTTNNQQLRAQIEAADMKPPQKARLLSDLNIAEKVNGAMATMHDLPMSEWKTPDELISEMAGDFNEAEVLRARGQIAQAQARAANMRQNDEAQYALSTDPTLQEQRKDMDGQAFVDKLYARYEKLGINGRRPLPVGEVKKTAEAFQAASPEETFNQIEVLKNNFGKHSRAVFKQMVDEGGLPPDYLLVAHMPNAESRIRMIENIKNAKNYDELISKGSTDIKAQKAAIPDVLSDNESYMEMLNLMRANDPSRAGFMRGLNNQINIEAKRNVLDGMNADDAVTKAVQRVLDDNYHSVTDGSFTAMIPKTIEVGRGQNTEVPRKTLDAFVMSHKNPNYYREAKIAVPQTFYDAFQQDMKPAEIEKRFHQDIMNNGYWDLASDQKSLILKYKDPFTQDVYALQNDEGKPISFDIAEIMSNPDEYQQKGLEFVYPYEAPLAMDYDHTRQFNYDITKGKKRREPLAKKLVNILKPGNQGLADE